MKEINPTKEISPQCWIFGHSRRVTIHVDTTRFEMGAAISASLRCARCGAPLPERVAKVVIGESRARYVVVQKARQHGFPHARGGRV